MLLASLRDIHRELGTLRTLPAAARWLVDVSFDVFVFEHGEGRPYPPRPSLDGLRLTEIDAGDVERLAAMNPALDAREVRRRLAEGLTGTIVWVEEEPVHVRWEAVADHYLPYLGLTFRLRPGDHHRLGAFTHPDWRDRGLHKRLGVWTLHASLERGHRCSFGLVARWNEPARRTILGTGWRQVGTIGFLRLGPLRRYVATGAARLGPDRSFSIDPPRRTGDEPGRRATART